MARGIDHLVLCVNDLSAARETYEALGFTMTPNAQHPFGTGNILAQLDGCFLEVLSVTEPEDIPPARGNNFSFGAFNQAFLEKRQGMSMLVMDSADEVADRDEFTRKNMHLYEPFTFQRIAKLPGGKEATVGFSLTFTDTPALDGLAFFTCKQWRPDLFWKPDYQSHANGATLISDVFIVTEDIESAGKFLSDLADAPISRDDEDAKSVATTRGHLSVLMPDTFDARFPSAINELASPTPFFAGFELAVGNIETAKKHLENNGFNVKEHNGQCWLAPSEAFNCLIALKEA